MAGHRWEDESHHGSPIWVCYFCGCRKSDKTLSQTCLKAEAHLARKAEELENAERYEYRQMLKAKARFEYLHAKYGSHLETAFD